MALDESKKDNDILDEEYGVKVIAEEKLAPYLKGAVIDYVESRFGGGFQINTPVTGEGCGCS